MTVNLKEGAAHGQTPAGQAQSPNARTILLRLLEDGAGIKLREADVDTSFVELGLDSLFLTQFSVSVSRQFKVSLSFRQLSSNLNSVARLAAFLDEASPPGKEEPAARPSAPQAAVPLTHATVLPASMQRSPALPIIQGAEADQLIRLFLAQIDILQQQLNALSGIVSEVDVSAQAAARRAGFDAAHPPVAGARLGRDPSGKPAWYVPDPKTPGKYLKID